MVRGEDPAVLGEALPIDRYAEIAAVPFYGKHQAASACNGDGRQYSGSRSSCAPPRRWLALILKSRRWTQATAAVCAVATRHFDRDLAARTRRLCRFTTWQAAQSCPRPHGVVAEADGSYFAGVKMVRSPGLDR
jgi:hypothetical protein